MRLFVNKKEAGNREFMDKNKFEVPSCPYVILLKPTGEPFDPEQIVVTRDKVVEKKLAAKDLAAALKKIADECEKKGK